MKILKDLDIKIVLFIITILLWVFVASGQNRIDTLPGKLVVEAKALKAGTVAVFDEDLISLKISAPRGIWEELSDESFMVFVDAEGKDLGTYEMTVRATTSIPNVQILDIRPAKVLVKIEPAVKTTIPVVVKTKGSLADGFTIGEVNTDPGEVEVEGAGSVVDKLTQATAQVYLSGEQSDIEKELKPVVLDEAGDEIRHLKFDPEKIAVKITVVKGGVAKVVGIKPNILGSTATGYWVSNITFEPSTIRITGGAKKLEELEYLVVDLDLAGQDSNFEKKLAPKIPEGIILLEGEPDTVTASVHISSLESSKLVIAGINYNGLEGRGLSVTSTTPDPLEIKVLVSGSSSILTSLNPTNVIVNINLYDKAAGSHQIEIKRSMISVPSGITVSNFVPSNIGLVITEL